MWLDYFAVLKIAETVKKTEAIKWHLLASGLLCPYGDKAVHTRTSNRLYAYSRND